ncbi:electron transfer flavoprotein subunit beta/FixA family protein [Marinilactibacillus piezotolerans]|uniref:electron transfer flavoprotein subunit beta/FixA family protein n=1 Tax=Marinilactibacillus piezotolerans TaxID=258723 RepID=UPI0009AFAC98|nr:electron transfer flavoprotein subunit beta/FixA family protein [Marinilactibacillus piezotolerans]
MSLKIVVCVKQVPVSNNLKIDPVTKNLIRSGEVGIMNPYDKNAIEAALRLKDEWGGEIILLSMGPSDFEMTLREGLAMGCDDAVLLSSRQFGGADTLATGYVLSQAIKQLGDVDLVLFGRQSVDADTSQVGPIVSEFLDWPQITFVSELHSPSKQTMTATRLLENMQQKIEFQLPAVITIRKELNEPRYPAPRNIQQSYKKTIRVWDENSLQVDAERIGLKGSPTVVQNVWAPEKEAKETTYLKGTPDEAVRELLIQLRSSNLL